MFDNNYSNLTQFNGIYIFSSRRGQMEKSSITRDFPVAKIVYSLLKDGVSSSFCLPGWNKGRIVCQQAQLKRILADMESATEGSEKLGIITLSNSPIPILGSKTNKAKKKRGSTKDEIKRGGLNGGTNIDTRTELVTSWFRWSKNGYRYASPPQKRLNWIQVIRNIYANGH